VIVRNSLLEKKYFEINNSQTQFGFLYVNLATVQFWGQSNKFPLSCNSLKCLLQVKKFIRENSTKKNLLLRKQTQPTNTFNWVLRSLSQSALGKFTTINKQKNARWSKYAWWIIFQWISMSLTFHQYQTQQKSHCTHHCYHCRVPKFLQNLSLLLTRSFCPLDTIAIASSARPTFTSSLIDVFSFVLRFFELVNRVFHSPCLRIT